MDPVAAEVVEHGMGPALEKGAWIEAPLRVLSYHT